MNHNNNHHNTINSDGCGTSTTDMFADVVVANHDGKEETKAQQAQPQARQTEASAVVEQESGAGNPTQPHNQLEHKTQQQEQEELLETPPSETNDENTTHNNSIMNEEVLNAISKAKWNESVTVELESECIRTTSSSMILMPKLDRENGGVKWEGHRVGSKEHGLMSENDARSAHLHTKKWMFPMLNDKRRNKLYERAIERASHAVAKRFPRATLIRTLDIGSGTGLLAMLSEKHLRTAFGESTTNSPKIQVTSLEMAGPMAELAKKTVELEGTKKLPPSPTVASSDPTSTTTASAKSAAATTAVAPAETTTSTAAPTPAEVLSSDASATTTTAAAAATARTATTTTTTTTPTTDTTTPIAAKKSASRKAAKKNTYPVEIIEGHSCKIPPLKINIIESETGDALPDGATSSPDSAAAGTSPATSGALLCTSELLESGLLGEGWLPALRDAWDRHLHPQAVVLPQRARIMTQLVQGASNFCGPHQSVPLASSLERSFEPPSSTENAISSLRLFTTAPNKQSEEEPLNIGMLSDGSYDALTGQKHGIQVEIHADRFLSSDNDGGEPILKTLSDPITALHLDVTSPGALLESNGVPPTRTKFLAKESGTAEGILFWWELDLYDGDDDDNDNLTYSTQPGSDFQDHWHQCLYVFPPVAENKNGMLKVQKDEEYALLTSHTESRVHFVIKGGSNNPEELVEATPQQKIPPQTTPVAGPFRCWQLNDSARSEKFRNGIRYALESLAKNAAEEDKAAAAEADDEKEEESDEKANDDQKHENDATKGAAKSKAVAATVAATSSTFAANVLDISDFSLCGMMASLLGARMVTSVESSSSRLPLEAAKVAQIGNGLPKNETEFQIVQCHAETLTRDIVLPSDQKKKPKKNLKRKRVYHGEEEEKESPTPTGIVDLVVGEPYYEMLEGWPIETALNYFYTLRMLKRKGIVKPNALSVPARAVILACGIECPELGTAYNKNLSASEPGSESTAQTSAHVCGFDHTPVAECWNYDQKGISLPLWEYNNVVPVTETVMVGMLDYESNSIVDGNWIEKKSDESTTNHSFLMAPFTKGGRTCHAIAVWVDYGIRKESVGSSNTDDEGEFEMLSTGFGASDQSSQPTSSRISERQTVRILAKAQPSILGESLVIPRHGLEL